VVPDAIPAALRQLPRWVVWRYTWNPDKKRKDGSGDKGDWDKPPSDVRGGAASSTDSQTWATFGQALAAYQTGAWDGIGFIPTPDDGLTVIDLDHCRDPLTGTIEPWAAAIVAEMGTYTEVSPSGTGLRLVARGRKPGRLAKKGLVEIYDGLTKEGKPGGRYLTFTGHHLEGTPAEACERQEALAAVYGRELKGEKPAGDDDVLIDRIKAGGVGDKVQRLWKGDWKTDGYPSQSEADLALCTHLAQLAGQKRERVERLFGRSELGKRAKWTERPDYRQATLDRALAGRNGEQATGVEDGLKAGEAAPAPEQAPAAEGKPKPQTGYQIILEHFRRTYAPTFKRGAVLYSGALGREVKAHEALLGPPAELLDLLAQAADAPRDKHGVDVQALPNFFATWARSAWVDLISPLPEEDACVEINDTAQDQFHATLKAALSALVALGSREYGAGKAEVTEVERRSLIDWCVRFAKPGRWARIRSLYLWVRREPCGDGDRLAVALRVELFSQTRFGGFGRLTQNKFGRLATLYGAGQDVDNPKVCGVRCTFLAPEFIDELLAGPADA
jgi:hypothetical protein